MSALTDYILNQEPQFKSRSRLISLYSDFSHQKTVNADGYWNNVTIWIKALENAARRGLCPGPRGSNDLLILHTGQELINELEVSERGRPMALGVVMREGIASRQVISLENFLYSQSSIYTQGWIASSWGYVSRALRDLASEGLGLQGKSHVPESVVLLSNIEEAGKRVESQVSKTASLVERVYAREAFEERFRSVFQSGANLTDNDFEALLKYLSRDRKLIAYNSQVVRILTAGESEIVTSQDETIASIKIFLESLDSQISELSKKIETCQIAAKEAVASKNRNKALMLLKSKKIAEEQLSRRSDTWFQMKAVYDKIAEAVDQVQILRVMENSATTLRLIHDQIGGTDRVEKIVDSLQEEISKTDEVTTVMNEPSNGIMIDEEEIERELVALQEKDADQLGQAEPDERLQELPDLPSELGPHLTPTSSKPQGDGEEEKASKAIEESTSRLQQLEL